MSCGSSRSLLLRASVVLFGWGWFIWRSWGSHGPLLLLPKGVEVVSQGQTISYLLLGAEHGGFCYLCLLAAPTSRRGKTVTSAQLKGFLDQEACCDWVPSCSAFSLWCLWVGLESLRLTRTKGLPRLDHISFKMADNQRIEEICLKSYQNLWQSEDSNLGLQ